MNLPNKQTNTKKAAKEIAAFLVIKLKLSFQLPSITTQ